MDNRIELPEARLSQLRQLIRIEAQKKVLAAKKITEDEKGLNHSLQNDAFKYSELFDALNLFNEDSYKIFDNLGRIFRTYLEENNYDKDGMFRALFIVMSLINEVNSKRDFISEKKEEYSTLLDHLEELQAVDLNPDKF